MRLRGCGLRVPARARAHAGPPALGRCRNPAAAGAPHPTLRHHAGPDDGEVPVGNLPTVGGGGARTAELPSVPRVPEWQPPRCRRAVGAAERTSSGWRCVHSRCAGLWWRREMAGAREKLSVVCETAECPKARWSRCRGRVVEALAEIVVATRRRPCGLHLVSPRGQNVSGVTGRSPHPAVRCRAKAVVRDTRGVEDARRVAGEWHWCGGGVNDSHGPRRGHRHAEKREEAVV